MSNKISEDTFKNVANGIIESAEIEFKNEHQDKLNKAKQIVDSKNYEDKLWLENYEREQAYNIILKQKYGENYDMATDIYLNRERYSNVLDKIFEEFEGRACSHDKSSHVIRRYLYSLEDNQPFVTGNKKDFWVPSKIKPEHIEGIIKGIYDLKYGNIQTLITSYTKILTTYGE